MRPRLAVLLAPGLAWGLAMPLMRIAAGAGHGPFVTAAGMGGSMLLLGKRYAPGSGAPPR